jgi:hypothetical protein
MDVLLYFDVNNLAQLVEIYDEDFSYYDRAIIRGQPETHILRVRRHATFSTSKYTAGPKMVHTFSLP